MENEYTFLKNSESFLFNLHKGRCLHFFTTVVTPFAEKFRLHGMKDIPTTLSYLTPSDDRPEPLLGIGDDGGDVFVLRFLKPSVSLFKKREVDTEVEYIYWRVSNWRFEENICWLKPYYLFDIGAASAGRNGDAKSYARNSRRTCPSSGFKNNFVTSCILQQKLNNLVDNSSHTPTISWQ